MPYADRWLGRGDRLWPIARHLVKVVEGVPGARQWRQQLSLAACRRQAGAEVLEQAAQLLEQGQLEQGQTSAPPYPPSS
jgi:tRNA-dihydrouridine synthase A